jgi:hypothetical protein
LCENQLRSSTNVKLTSLSIEYLLKVVSFSTATWAKTCKLSDSDFDQCNYETIRGIFDNAFSGNFKVEGIESLNPMTLDKVTILQGDGPIAGNASLYNLKIYGLPEVQLLKQKFNPEDLSWTQLMKIPKMRLEANYQMMGRILVIPLNVTIRDFLCVKTQLRISSFRGEAGAGLSRVRR